MADEGISQGEMINIASEAIFQGIIVRPPNWGVPSPLAYTNAYQNGYYRNTFIMTDPAKPRPGNEKSPNREEKAAQDKKDADEAARKAKQEEKIAKRKAKARALKQSVRQVVHNAVKSVRGRARALKGNFSKTVTTEGSRDESDLGGQGDAGNVLNHGGHESANHVPKSKWSKIKSGLRKAVCAPPSSTGLSPSKENAKQYQQRQRRQQATHAGAATVPDGIVLSSSGQQSPGSTELFPRFSGSKNAQEQIQQQPAQTRQPESVEDYFKSQNKVVVPRQESRPVSEGPSDEITQVQPQAAQNQHEQQLHSSQPVVPTAHAHQNLAAQSQQEQHPLLSNPIVQTVQLHQQQEAQNQTHQATQTDAADTVEPKATTGEQQQAAQSRQGTRTDAAKTEDTTETQQQTTHTHPGTQTSGTQTVTQNVQPLQKRPAHSAHQTSGDTLVGGISPPAQPTAQDTIFPNVPTSDPVKKLVNEEREDTADGETRTVVPAA